MCVACVAGIGIGILIAFYAEERVGDILAFAGALIGAAVAVIGAVIASSRQAILEAAEARSYQRELLNSIKSHLETLAKDAPLDEASFNKRKEDNDEAISALEMESLHLMGHDIYRTAGWNIETLYLRRRLNVLEPLLKAYVSEGKWDYTQDDLSQAITNAKLSLNDAIQKVDACLEKIGNR